MSSLFIKLKFNENVRHNFYCWVSGSIENSLLNNIRSKNQESKKIKKFSVTVIVIVNTISKYLRT